MKSLFTALLLVLSVNAYGAQRIPQPAEVKYLANSGRQGGIQKIQLGNQLIDRKPQLLKATYDFSVHGASTTAAVVLSDETGGDATIPDNAIITNVWFDVLTDPVATGATTGTISFGLSNDSLYDNLKADTAIATWTGLVAGIPVGSAATSIKTTAEVTVSLSIEHVTLTAGKITAFIQYLVSQ